MSRYVDVDKVLEKYSEDGNWDLHKVLKGELTADVRENVHGEWRRDFSGNEFYWYCTNCKEEYYEDDLYMGGNEFPNFCPNCGADMRKGVTDDGETNE